MRKEQSATSMLGCLLKQMVSGRERILGGGGIAGFS